MRIDWTSKSGEKISAIYFAESLNLNDVKKFEAEGVDYLQVWYPKKHDDDIFAHYGDALNYIELDGSWTTKANSLRLDLTQSAQDILAGMETNRRYKVKRAKKRDNLMIDIIQLNEGKELQDYLELQNTGENAHKVDEEIVLAMVKQKIFYLGVCRSADGVFLANHSYLADENDKWVFMFSSKTNYGEEAKSYGSRPASLLHYEAMLYFKEKGYREYDFSGYFIADKETERNKKHLSVSKFKKSFVKTTGGGGIVAFDSGIVIPISKTKRIEENINKLLSILKNKQVALWGMSNLGKFALKVLDTKGIKPVLLIDNKLAEEESTYSFQDALRARNPANTVVLVATTLPTYQKILQEDVCAPFVDGQQIYCLCDNV